MDVLTMQGLRKKYRGKQGALANDGINLSVPPGHIVGLLGHNGAGKTTLVNQIVGLVRPDAGSITLDGIDAIAQPHLARQKATLQAQANVPITGLTPRTAIELVGRIRGGNARDMAQRTTHLIDALDLGQWANTPAQKISGGVARLTAFAMTAVNPGALIILDEPTNDVDPVRRRLLWNYIQHLADDGHGVLLVTHNVHEAERAVHRLTILDQGRVIAEGTPAELTAHLNDQLTLDIDLTDDDITFPEAVTLTRRDRRRRTGHLHVDAATSVVAWAQHMTHIGTIDRYQLSPTSLEDVYITLVGKSTPNHTTTEHPEQDPS